jgi:hypothetical protein
MSENISLKIDDEEIVFADLTNRENLEAVCVCGNGNIFLFDLLANEHYFVKTLEFPIIYSEEFLNYSSSIGSQKEFLQIKTNQHFLCITQKYGQNGIVLDLSNPDFQKNLERGDYQMEHCQFPIAFYKNGSQTFLIHGTDWNRLDITCLETDRLLTNRIVEYETKSNYFDYFHSSLLMSPNEKHFTSNGWFWGPCDNVTVYSVNKFLQEFEVSNVQLNFREVDGYNWDRPLCWIDNQTLGIGYNKKEANDGEGDFVSEITFINILENKIVNRISFDGFALSEYGATEGDLFYDIENKYFIGLNKKNGLLISDVEGNEIFKDSTFTTHKYSVKHKLIYQIDIKNQLIKFEKLQK